MHIFQLRIYYEDTDAGGVVYYANYLKFAERARTEMLRGFNISQRQWLEKNGLAFVVRHAEMDLTAPARLDDEITITTKITGIRPASLTLHQQIMREGESLATIQVKIACINAAFKPCALPKELLEKFSKTM